MNEKIQLNYLSHVSTKAQFLTRKLKFLSFKTIKGKIAHYLLELNHGKGSVLKLTLLVRNSYLNFSVLRALRWPDHLVHWSVKEFWK